MKFALLDRDFEVTKPKVWVLWENLEVEQNTL